MMRTNAEYVHEQEQNEQMIGSGLRQLTANLIRISRGSGSLHEVEAQVMELAELFAKHRNITSHGVSPHIFDKALNYDPVTSLEDQETATLQRVRSQIVRGALQIAASALVDNNTTKHQGETELLEGQLQWEELRNKSAAKG